MVDSRTFSYIRIGMISLACLGLAPLALSASAGTNADRAWQKAGADEGLRQAFERATYALKDSGHGTWRGANAAQRLTLEFNGNEARLSHPDGSVNFHLTGYGYGDRLHKPAPAKLTGTGNRVEYQRGDLTEWYVNGAQGLEQGFTLAQRPETNREGEPLVIALGVSGGLLPAQETDDGSVLFESGKGVVLRYAGLKALDARGRTLPSRLEVQGREIRLIVGDRDAQYPLVVDPMVVDPLWTQQQELTTSDGASLDQFGFAVAVDGDTAVIGAWGKTVNSHAQQGAAYVFVRSSGVWTLQQELTASDGAAGDHFGYSVSLSGDTAVIGAGGHNYSWGAAYVFVRTGVVWSQQQELAPSDTGGQFGFSVSVCGDTALVGALSNNGGVGAAYAFVRSSGIWTQQQELTASDGATGDLFGYSVSLSGDTAVVGANFKSLNSSTYQGAVYVFVRSDEAWTQQQKLIASDGTGGDEFGLSVSVLGDTLVVGAAFKTVNSQTETGAAYVFARSGGTWTQQQELTASDGAAFSLFGFSVSVGRDTAVIGAHGINSSTGAVYVFVRSDGIWTQQQELSASDGAPTYSFGAGVSLSGDTSVIGAATKNSSQGAAYAFVRPRLGTNALLVGAPGGSSSVVLAYGGAWTATANDSFLHISPGSASGTGNAVVVFSYDGYTGAGARTGTLTIAGQMVTVTQAGTSYFGPAMIESNPATTLATGLACPTGIAVDSSGNVYTADFNDSTIQKWAAATQQMSPLVSSGLNLPAGLAIDASGNVYIADTYNYAIKEWNAATQQVSTLVSSGLNGPSSVAVDVWGNVYIADALNNAIKEWNAATQQVSTLVSSGLSYPYGVAVDVSGNLYIADRSNNAIKEWNAATQQVTTLVSTGLNYPSGVAVDGSGNVYIADWSNNAVKEWSASTQQVTTLVSLGLYNPGAVVVDGSGNLFIGDTNDDALKEVPYAFVDARAFTEPASAGTDSLLPVLPSTASLTGVFAPTSDQSWLTIGTVANGVVSFSFTTNTSASRVAHISILGQQIKVTQNGLPQTVPSVFIDSPASGATVSGTVTVSGWAISSTSTVGTAIGNVLVLVNGVAVGTATYGISRPDVCAAYPGRAGCPYVGFTYSLNAGLLSLGPYTISVAAANTDATPATGSASVTVTVAGLPLAPSVFIDSPASGATVSGTVTVAGWAIDNTMAIGTAISNVKVWVDGTQVGTATYGVGRPDVCAAYPGRAGCPNVGYTYSLNTATLTAGSHTIMVTATDSDGSPDTGSASVTVAVAGPAVPPSVFIDSPAAGATVSGTVTVSGWAIDNTTAAGSAIGSVKVLVDGTQVGTATYGVNRGDVCAAYPGRPGCPNVGYTYSLNTAGLTPGSHTIKISATDSDSSPDTGSASVTVTVSGAVAPSVFIDAPAPGAAVSGTVSVSGWAIDNTTAIGTAIGSVKVLVDGTQVGTATYGVSRPDVCAAYPGRLGCPNVGYTYSLNTATLTAGSHTIMVTATDSDGSPDTGSASVTVTVSGGATAPSVFIDSPASGAPVSGTVTVAGWAIDNTSAVGTAISGVKVWVDGTQVGTATYGVSRGDVCAAYPGRAGCPNVGYTYSLDTATLTAGSHTIMVTATDSDGSPDTGSATITVQK